MRFILALIVATAVFTTNVYAISFIHAFTSITGEVTSITQAASGGIFAEIEGDEVSTRFYISPYTYVLGDNIDVGDVITGYFRTVALAGFEGEVLSMTRNINRRYTVNMRYNGGWIGSVDGTLDFTADFERNFLQPFEVGDKITAYYNPWGAPYIFDMPQYSVKFVVNGDGSVYVGSLNGNVVSNMARGRSGDTDEGLTITDDLKIITSNGELFGGALKDNDILAVVLNGVLNGTEIEKVVVIWQLLHTFGTCL